jgi:hypothetical protein
MAIRGHTSFFATASIRVTIPDHGITTQTQKVRMVKRSDGTVAAITQTEWRRMVPPLIVQDASGQWWLGGTPVEIKHVGGKEAIMSIKDYQSNS